MKQSLILNKLVVTVWMKESLSTVRTSSRTWLSVNSFLSWPTTNLNYSKYMQKGRKHWSRSNFYKLKKKKTELRAAVELYLLDFFRLSMAHTMYFLIYVLFNLCRDSVFHVFLSFVQLFPYICLFIKHCWLVLWLLLVIFKVKIIK